MSTRTEGSWRRGRRAPRPLVVAALCAVVLGFGPTTAQAQSVTHPDAVGDVVTFEDHDVSISAPGRRLNDVASTRLTHGTHRVAVRVRFVDLRRVGDVQGLLVPMVTDEGVRRYLQLVAHPRRWSGETSLFNGGFGEVPCRGVRHSIDYRRNVMRASFPRHCASSPRWVKFRAVSYAQARRFYADDALSDDPVISETENDLAWSGRVRHQPST